MNDPDRPVQRHLDGPRLVRRPLVGTQTAQASNGPAISAETQAPESVVFEYHKPKQISRRRQVLVGAGVIAGMLLVGVVGKTILATQKVITRNAVGGAPALAGEIDPTKLRGEGDGRINILMMGIGGSGHEGANLSDTLIVASIDPRTKDVAMLSLPRDLWVPIPGFGSGKINAAHAYGESRKVEGGGPALAKLTISKLLDLPIHYYARIDFNGFKKGIDAVGGVDVVVEKNLHDPQYPADKGWGFAPFSLKAGPQHLNGAMALRFARCRHGSCGNDFGRAARQQQLLVAFRDKVLSLPTLTSPSKMGALLDTVGSSARTDLQVSELWKLMEIMEGIDGSKVVSKVLDNSPDGLLVSGNIGGAYVELPRTGNWEEIRGYVHGIFADAYIKEEAAKIEVQNGTRREGLANTVAKLLKVYNYNVVKTATAANQDYPQTVIYDYSGGKKSYTLSYLENRFGVKAQRAEAVAGDPDIRIVVGANYKAVNTTSR
jgi:polyisoprenyl-teichoic acid--peptidoglycan teichoic acid transferase